MLLRDYPFCAVAVRLCPGNSDPPNIIYPVRSRTVDRNICAFWRQRVEPVTSNMVLEDAHVVVAHANDGCHVSQTGRRYVAPAAVERVVPSHVEEREKEAEAKRA